MIYFSLLYAYELCRSYIKLYRTMVFIIFQLLQNRCREWLQILCVFSFGWLSPRVLKLGCYPYISYLVSKISKLSFCDLYVKFECTITVKHPLAFSSIITQIKTKFDKNELLGKVSELWLFSSLMENLSVKIKKFSPLLWSELQLFKFSKNVCGHYLILLYDI